MQQLRPHLRARAQITALGKRPASTGPGCWGTMTLADLLARDGASGKAFVFPTFDLLRTAGSWVRAACGRECLSGVARGWQVMCVLYVSTADRLWMTWEILAANNPLTPIPWNPITPSLALSPRFPTHHPPPTSHLHLLRPRHLHRVLRARSSANLIPHTPTHLTNRTTHLLRLPLPPRTTPHTLFLPLLLPLPLLLLPLRPFLDPFLDPFPHPIPPHPHRPNHIPTPDHTHARPDANLHRPRLPSSYRLQRSRLPQRRGQQRRRPGRCLGRRVGQHVAVADDLERGVDFDGYGRWEVVVVIVGGVGKGEEGGGWEGDGEGAGEKELVWVCWGCDWGVGWWWWWGGLCGPVGDEEGVEGGFAVGVEEGVGVHLCFTVRWGFGECLVDKNIVEDVRMWKEKTVSSALPVGGGSGWSYIFIPTCCGE